MACQLSPEICKEDQTAIHYNFKSLVLSYFTRVVILYKEMKATKKFDLCQTQYVESFIKNNIVGQCT